MVQKWNVTIPELTGEEARGVYVYLPEGYEWERERRYPVLYMFDGHNVFFDSDATYGKSWGWSATTTRTTGGCRSIRPTPSTSPTWATSQAGGRSPWTGSSTASSPRSTGSTAPSQTGDTPSSPGAPWAG